MIDWLDFHGLRASKAAWTDGQTDGHKQFWCFFPPQKIPENTSFLFLYTCSFGSQHVPVTYQMMSIKKDKEVKMINHCNWDEKDANENVTTCGDVEMTN